MLTEQQSHCKHFLCSLTLTTSNHIVRKGFALKERKFFSGVIKQLFRVIRKTPKASGPEVKLKTLPPKLF